MREDKPDARPDSPGKWRPRERGERVLEALATRVRGFAFNALSPGRRATSNLYMDPHQVRKGTRIGPVSRSYVVDRDSILCFADHYPRAAFAHQCSYYLHDVRTGELYRRIAAEFPPYPTEGLHQLERFHQPALPPRGYALPRVLESRFETRMRRALSGSATAGKRYAILFAGECDRFHANDLELSYRTLIKTFNFDPDNVFALINDGTRTGAPFLADDGVSLRNWPGDDTAFTLNVKGSGSREDFGNLLDSLHLTQDDLLFIHTAGHGGWTYSDGQYLRLRPDGSDSYFSHEMQDDLMERLGGRCQSLLVFMNQCFSGGFSDAMLAAGSSKAQRTFFAAACGADEWAHSTEDLNWSEFALNWYEAEMQHHIDPAPYMPGTDDDGDGKVEASEAYDYCVFMNTLTKGFDTPVFARLPPPGPSGDSPADEIALV